MPAPSADVLRSRTAAIAACAALLAIGLAWELWLAPLRPGGSWWALKVLPLLGAVRGLWHLRMYTYRWLSLLVWLYVTEGIVRATTERGLSMGLAIAQTLAALLLFAACGWHVRSRFRAAREATAPAP